MINMYINAMGCESVVSVRDLIVKDPHTRAFTMLEMIVVLTLLAIMAAAVLLSPTKWFRSTRLPDVINQIAMLDHLARHQAVRFSRPVSLTFDLNKGTVHRSETLDPSKHSHRMKLPGHVKIARVVMASTPPVSFGKAIVPCSTHGQTPTYALLLKPPDDSEQWVVVAGLTGQTVKVHDEKKVYELLQQLVP